MLHISAFAGLRGAVEADREVLNVGVFMVIRFQI